jgi:hypothetical protein
LFAKYGRGPEQEPTWHHNCAKVDNPRVLGIDHFAQGHLTGGKCGIETNLKYPGNKNIIFEGLNEFL